VKTILNLAAGVALTLAAGAAMAQEVRLRAAMFVPPNTAFGEPCKKWIDRVNETGKGQIQITQLDMGAVPPFELGNAVSSGVLDAACVPPAYYKGKMVEGEATVFANTSFLAHRASGAWAALNKLHNEKMNAQYVAAYGDGVPFHLFLARPAASAADLKGRKVRSTPVFQSFFADAGMATVTTPPGEAYTALERGTVEGYGWAYWGIHDFSWDRFTKYRVDPGFYNVNINVLVNLAKYRTLDAAQKKLLDDSGVWLETEFPKWRDVRSAEEAKKQAASGIAAIDFGPAWRKQANDAYFAELEKASPENMRMLRKLIVKE